MQLVNVIVFPTSYSCLCAKRDSMLNNNYYYEYVFESSHFLAIFGTIDNVDLFSSGQGEGRG